MIKQQTKEELAEKIQEIFERAANKIEEQVGKKPEVPTVIDIKNVVNQSIESKNTQKVFRYDHPLDEKIDERKARYYNFYYDEILDMNPSTEEKILLAYVLEPDKNEQNLLLQYIALVQLKMIQEVFPTKENEANIKGILNGTNVEYNKYLKELFFDSPLPIHTKTLDELIGNKNYE